MKKKIILLFIFLILLCTLSACGNSFNEEKQSIGKTLFGTGTEFSMEYWSYIDGYAVKRVHFNGDVKTLKIPEEYDDGENGRKPVVAIGKEAITWAPDGLKNVVLPDSLLEINENAFWGCHSLRSITIPKNVYLIQGSAFAGCFYLEKIEVDPENQYFLVENKCLYSPSMYIGEVVLVAGCCDSVIPLDKGITKIDSGAFYGRNTLKDVVIPDTTNLIGDRAFTNCQSLTEIVIPDSVRVIGAQCFSGCSALKTAVLSRSTRILPYEAFFGCSVLESIVIPDCVTQIGKGAFSYCSALETATIGKGVEVIEEEAFSHCRVLGELLLPESVRRIGKGFVFNCISLKKITFEKEARWRMTIQRQEFQEECGGIEATTKKITANAVYFTGSGNYYRQYLYQIDGFGPDTE